VTRMQGWNSCSASGSGGEDTNIESLRGPSASDTGRGIDVRSVRECVRFVYSGICKGAACGRIRVGPRGRSAFIPSSYCRYHTPREGAYARQRVSCFKRDSLRSLRSLGGDFVDLVTYYRTTKEMGWGGGMG
jgi:hypothetical protein